MLTVEEAIKQRRSIRRYTSDDVPDEIIDQMLEAARLAPSGGNQQPWRFILVRDPKVKEDICQLSYGQRFIADAPVAIVCFADLFAYSQDARKNYWNDYTQAGIQTELSGRLATPEFWDKAAAAPWTREQELRRAMAMTYIAIEHMVLMATALGLGTCWIGAADFAGINKYFSVPENITAVAVLTVGYPAAPIPKQRPRKKMEQILLKPLPQHAAITV